MANKKVTYVVQVPIPAGGPASSGALARDYAFEGLQVLMRQGAFSLPTVSVAVASDLVALSLQVNSVVPVVIAVTSGVDYTGAQYLSASGGVDPYTFTATLADVPPGLTINSDGTITGTATTPGTYVVHILITDGIGATATKTCTIVVS